MMYGYIVANDSCNGLPSNVNSFRSTSSSSSRLSRLLYGCCLPDMVTLLPIAQIKTKIKAVRRLYLAIQCTCLSTNVIPDHSVQSVLCLSIIISLPEPRHI